MKTSNLIIAGFAITLLVYLAYAFVLWDFNPGNWDKTERIGLMIYWFVAMFICGCVVVFIYDLQRDKS